MAKTKRALAVPVPEAQTDAPDHAHRSPWATCPQCGAVVQVMVWHHDTGWRDLPGRLSPLDGAHHECENEEGLT
jgi:hypothetical protein